jgi:hypothetical protein
LNKYESFVTQKVPKVHFGMGKENGGKVIEGRKWKHAKLRRKGKMGVWKEEKEEFFLSKYTKPRPYK